MATKISTTFDVTSWDEHEFDVHAGAGKLTRATVKKSYSGGVTGTSLTQWLMAYASDGTATFVGLERIDATVESGQDALTGTLVLQHIGNFRDGAATADLAVLAGSSAGDFAGIEGAGSFVADPGGKVELELDLP